MEYRLFESPPERFRSEVLEFFRTGGSGVNVTVPHKRAATDLVNELTPRAQVANAINTIVRQDEGLVGDNTDGAGLLADLTRNLRLNFVLAPDPAARRRRRGTRGPRSAARAQATPPRRREPDRGACRRDRGGLRVPRAGQRL